MRGRSVRIWIACVLNLSVPGLLVAQQARTPPPGFPTGGTPGRIVIDGSRNPELIPERVAIGMFMSSVAVPASVDKRTLRSVHARLAPLKLTPSDMGILRTELAKLHVRLQAHRETMVAAHENVRRLKTPAASAAFTAAVEARDTLAVDSFERVQGVLSPAGAGRLRGHIAVVRSQMKGFGASR